jgi:hypothetical protein
MLGNTDHAVISTTDRSSRGFEMNFFSGAFFVYVASAGFLMAIRHLVWSISSQSRIILT